MTVRRGLPITIISLLLSAPAWAQGGSGQTLEIGRLRLLAPPAKTSETACLWRDASTGDVVVGPCGTVTSVGLSMPAIFTVSGSPIETSGTLTATLTTQTGWSVWRVPDGSTAAPAFGALAKGHLPAVTLYRDADVLPDVSILRHLGSDPLKYATVNAAELRVSTLVAQDKIATIGGKHLTGPTTVLIADVGTGDTTIDVQHNSLRAGDIVILEAGGAYEQMVVTTAPSEVSGGYRHTVERDHDETGANAWVAGDVVFAGGAQAGEGYVETTADRSTLAPGYAGQVVARLPAYYWRFTSSGTVTAPTVGAALTLTARGAWASGYATADAGGSLYRDSTVSSVMAAELSGVNTRLDGTGSLTFSFFLAKGGGSAVKANAVILRTGGTADALAGVVMMTGGNIGTANDIRLTVGNGTARSTVASSGGTYVLNDGTWRHYVGVVDRAANEIRVYVNGVSVASGTLGLSGSYASTANVLDVLSMDQTNLDEVALFNRALTADEVARLYASRLSVLGHTAAGPTVRGIVRTGPAAPDLAARWTVGQLLGTCGYTTSTFGFVAGDCASTWVSADATHGFRVMYGAEERLTADTSGNLSLVGDLTVDTPGRILAGGGAVEISAGGIAINTTTTESSFNAYKFSSSNAGSHGLYGYYGSATKWTQLWSETSGTSQTAVVALGARGRDSSGVVSGVSLTLTGAAVSSDASLEITVQAAALRVLPDGVQVQGSALFPFGTNATSLGTSSRRWSAFYLTDASTSEQSAIYPVVIDTGNNHRVSVVTDGAQGTTTCSGAQRISSITIRRGLVISVTCS